ncbi:hypothetical protein [Pseudonocardia hydrocarbonoxydans]|uniref:hypothetical protein n=1 Tax=Pseudonocardia hydrocarbonoxydans TaxID=76726 RepID=UPI0031D5C12B
MLVLPVDAAARQDAIADHLTSCRVAGLCRPGDRIVELVARESALLPLLLRRGTHPHSLTVVHGTTPGSAADRADNGLPFPVTRRRSDPAGAWPVAGPVDLVVDTSAAYSTASVLRTVGNAADLLTLGGRLVLSSSATSTDLPAVLQNAGFTIDEVHGVELPDSDEQVERVLLDRFGRDAIALYRTIRLECEPEFARPVIATSLGDDAATVLQICRRTR